MSVMPQSLVSDGRGRGGEGKAIAREVAAIAETTEAEAEVATVMRCVWSVQW